MNILKLDLWVLSRRYTCAYQAKIPQITYLVSLGSRINCLLKKWSNFFSSFRSCQDLLSYTLQMSPKNHLPFHVLPGFKCSTSCHFIISLFVLFFQHLKSVIYFLKHFFILSVRLFDIVDWKILCIMTNRRHFKWSLSFNFE